MKRILFLLLFVCSFASGQIQKLEVIGLDTLTTTERNTITVPGDRVYFIYNETTGQFEYNVKGSGWTTFSGGGISNLVEDTTPQLGGDLDVNGNNIFSNAGIELRLDEDNNSSGNFVLTNGADETIMQASESGRFDFQTAATINPIFVFGPHDAPSVSTKGAFYSDDSENRPKYYDGTSWKSFLLDGDVSAGSGDVVGPASATDNAIARFDTTTGKLLQNSGVTINDSGTITTSGAVNAASVVMTNGAKTSDANGLFVLQSNDASNEMELQINRLATNFNHFQINAIEQGVAFRPIVLNRSGGNVGINTGATTPPSEALDVNGNIAVSGTVDGVDIAALAGNVLEGNNIVLPSATTRTVDLTPTSILQFDGNTGATSLFQIDGSGLVDFPTVTPSAPVTAYGVSWNGSDKLATEDAIYDEMETKVDGTISGRTSVTTVTAIGTQTVANYLSDGVPSAGEWVGLSDATPEYLTTSATFNFALLDEYNYDDSTTDAATITFSNMGEGHKVRIKYNRASAPTYSGETPTQLPNTFSAGSWPANDDVEAVYYKRFGTVYYFFKEL